MSSRDTWCEYPFDYGLSRGYREIDFVLFRSVLRSGVNRGF